MREDGETLVVRCDCSGPHFVQVYFPGDDDAYAFFTLTTEPTTWRERLRFVWRMLVRGWTDYPTEAVLGPQGLDELISFLIERRSASASQNKQEDS